MDATDWIIAIAAGLASAVISGYAWWLRGDDVRRAEEQARHWREAAQAKDLQIARLKAASSDRPHKDGG